jgi:hypothetical protein
MGEPERRRRRLRPSHGPAGEAPEAADSAAAGPAENVVTAPADSRPADSKPIDSTPTDSTPTDSTPTETAAIEDPADDAPKRPRPGFTGRPRPASGDDREVERGLRGLVGSGSSQVSVGAALRARDAARPTDAQLAEAEQTLAIVRRNWTPREELPRNR